jgi:hypothetical protein
METPGKLRWYCPTPAWLVLGSLAVTGLLWLSNWLGWWHKGYAVLVAVAGVGTVLAGMLLWWLVALIFRWRFQLGIRTLLVLTLAAALPFSWLAVEMQKAREQKGAVAAIVKAGGFVFYDYQVDDAEDEWGDELAKPSGPAWLRDMIGVDMLSDVTLVVGIACTDLAHISSFRRLQRLFINDRVGDADLARLHGLKELKRLDAGTCIATKQAVERFRKALPSCELCWNCGGPQ